MQINGKVSALLSCSIVVASLAFGGIAANAAPSTTDAAQSVTSTQTNSSCVAAITAAQLDGTTGLSTSVCTSTVTLTTTAARAITTDQLAGAKQSLSSPDYQSLVAATAAGTVKGKGYAQVFNNLTDRETQSGYMYWDGARVWVTQSYRGYQGNHQCLVSYAIGYTVENKACSDTGSTTRRTLTAQWLLTVVATPISWTEVRTMYATSSGAISQ